MSHTWKPARSLVRPGQIIHYGAYDRRKGIPHHNDPEAVGKVGPRHLFSWCSRRLMLPAKKSRTEKQHRRKPLRQSYARAALLFSARIARMRMLFPKPVAPGTPHLHRLPLLSASQPSIEPVSTPSRMAHPSFLPAFWFLPRGHPAWTVRARVEALARAIASVFG